MTEIRIPAFDQGDFAAYIALPQDGDRHPGILVIQEIFGVNADMRRICDEWAARGYAAICPDLFWRQEPGVQLTDKTEADWARAFQLYQGFDVALGIRDLQSALTALRRHPACNGKVGAVGFCLGGKLAYLMATDTDIDASVGYYGVAIESDLGKAAQIEKPLMLHIAEKDKYVPPAAQQQIKSALNGNPHVTLHSYAGQDHAFTRIGGEHYDAAAAKLAHERTERFFAEALR